MRHRIVILIVVCGFLAVLVAPSARAQRPPNLHRPNGLQNRSTVSPYLNLGVSSNGISNYGSLVRPLLNARETQAQQAMASARRRVGAAPRGQAVDARGIAAQSESPASGSPRFMNLSHYYGGGR